MSSKNQQHKAVDSPFYFPLGKGRYEVKPGLYKFPHDFGNGLADRQIFQFDASFSRYRSEKLAARTERLEKYYCQHGFDNSVSSTINRFIIQNLIKEHSEKFHLEKKRGEYILHCRPSQEVLTFDRQYFLAKTSHQQSISPQYADGFDALACQLQEDISVIHLTETGNDQVTALHLCFQNHWAAEKKIGKSFIDVHQPVPDMEKINQSAKKLVQVILHKGPFVRFAWGVTSDTRLNQHPEPADMTKKDPWQGRAFNPQQPELYLRVERQTIHGFATEQLALFTIRTYLYDIKQVHANFPDRIPLLISAIESMSVSSMRYKGIRTDAPAILNWLKELAVS